MPYGKDSPQGLKPMSKKMSHDFSQETAEKAFKLALEFHKLKLEFRERSKEKEKHTANPSLFSFSDVLVTTQVMYLVLTGKHPIWPEDWAKSQ